MSVPSVPHPLLPRAAIPRMFIVVPTMAGGGRGRVDGQIWAHLRPKSAWTWSGCFQTRGHRHPGQKVSPSPRFFLFCRGRLGGGILFFHYHVVGQPKTNVFDLTSHNGVKNPPFRALQHQF